MIGEIGMKYGFTGVLLFMFLAAMSCVREDLEQTLCDNRVILHACVPVSGGQPSPVNKSGESGIRDYDYDGEMRIALARVDEGYLSYPDFVNCGAMLTATMGTPDMSTSSALREIYFDQAQFFPGNGNEISFAAWYPWPENAEEKGYDYSSGNDGTVVSFPIDGKTDILYSIPVSGSANNNFGVMEFNHALCLYNIYVYAMVYEDADGNDDMISNAWGALQDMKIVDMPERCEITLPRTIAGPDGSGIYESSLEYSGEKTIDLSGLSSDDNSIFFTPGETLPVGQANRIKVATFLASPPDDDIIDISLKTAESSAEQDISIARSFRPGYAYDIVLRFSDHGIINADVTVSDWEYGSTVEQEYEGSIYYDLSTYGTSNCYHISSANYGYCFNATVKGNGNCDGIGASPQDLLLNPAYVDIVWTDLEDNSSVVLPSHNLVDGKVMVNIQGNPDDQNDKTLKEEGNVLIAAYDKIPEKDASGHITNDASIIWTWHLWLSDPVQDQGYSNGFMIQDRNLGARDAVPDESGKNAWGLLYQWGRPTPFRNDVSPTPDPRSVSMAEAIANPEVIYGTAEDGNDVWIDDAGLRPYLENLWGYVSEWDNPRKTIYDPCPPGYRMLEERMWRNMEEYQVSVHEEYVHLNLVNQDNPIKQFDAYYPFQDTYLASGEYVEHGPGSQDDYGTFLWSGTIDISQNPHTPFRLIYSHDGRSLSTADDKRRNSAMPVRCVLEHSEMIVKDLSASQTANCYMVHEAGYYKFKADILGNGMGEILQLGGAGEVDLRDGQDVDISNKNFEVRFLWWQGDFTEVSSVASVSNGDIVDPEKYLKMSLFNNGLPDEDGYVTFYISEFHKGNLILAAYDPVDRLIIWTWHIWMTDEPKIKASGNYAVMDRFLGATTAPSSFSASMFSTPEEGLSTYGFYYQWGRKDPIPGPPLQHLTRVPVAKDDWETLESSVWWSYDYDSGKWTGHNYIEASPAVRISQSVREPMKFYTSSNGAGNANSTWFDPSFADGNRNVALWGYAVNGNDFGESFTKTMYDPCPPGYMVAEYKVWGGDASSTWYACPDDTYNDNNKKPLRFSHGEAGYNSRNGYGMVTTMTYFDYNWYPMTGRREPTTGYVSDAGWYGHFWTGTPMGSYNARSMYYDARQNQWSGQIIESGASGSMSTGQYQQITCGTGPAYGFPVRCMKQ